MLPTGDNVLHAWEMYQLGEEEGRYCMVLGLVRERARLFGVTCCWLMDCLLEVVADGERERV